MTHLEVFTQPEDPGVALARAAASMLREIRETMDLRTVDQLPTGECAVKVGGEWYGYAGVDSRGVMTLYKDDVPHFYPSSEGEPFVWHLLIGGIDR